MRADNLRVERAAVAATELSLARCAELFMAVPVVDHGVDLLAYQVEPFRVAKIQVKGATQDLKVYRQYSLTPMIVSYVLDPLAAADDRVRRAGHLRAAPARTRFLSLEPLLGPLPSLDLAGIDWVIAGGESGPGRRPVNPEWVRDLRDRAVAHGVPFFFKQWGARTPKAGGRELDGRTWDEFPAALHAHTGSWLDVTARPLSVGTQREVLPEYGCTYPRHLGLRAPHRGQAPDPRALPGSLVPDPHVPVRHSHLCRRIRRSRCLRTM